MKKNLTDIKEGYVSEGVSLLRRQLEREIICLERQVSRFKFFSGAKDVPEHSAYRDMIASRRRALAELT